MLLSSVGGPLAIQIEDMLYWFALSDRLYAPIIACAP